MAVGELCFFAETSGVGSLDRGWDSQSCWSSSDADEDACGERVQDSDRRAAGVIALVLLAPVAASLTWAPSDLDALETIRLFVRAPGAAPDTRASAYISR